MYLLSIDISVADGSLPCVPALHVSEIPKSTGCVYCVVSISIEQCATQSKTWRKWQSLAYVFAVQIAKGTCTCTHATVRHRNERVIDWLFVQILHFFSLLSQNQK